ncbi:4-coumarate--CoA ligase-like 5 [Eumeta japonica]|uniref:4-coumarate--CoA ligase-like 5 n=1 Tax=Eumeta variegata TaxID=151549 RepID=A0A4C1VBQ9_EUMVA|nr:4-coumarate--CoA ligase-like 5 [Eumeta japonica]
MLAKEPDHQQCDFSCFREIYMGGSAVPEELLTKYRELAPDAVVARVYGMTELSGFAFCPDPTRAETCGRKMGCFEYRLQDPFTGEEIVKPNVSGELQLRGPGVFKGYFNNAKATNETFTDDGWFRTGDLLFRDEDFNFYFVERFKLLLKYRNHQAGAMFMNDDVANYSTMLMAQRRRCRVARRKTNATEQTELKAPRNHLMHVRGPKAGRRPSSLFVDSQIAPLELENVIRSHPGVLDVAVAGVPAECGDLPWPAWCAARDTDSLRSRSRTSSEVSTTHENLADSKQLRGGVIFLDQLPMTASMKPHRKKINQLILSSIRE